MSHAAGQAHWQHGLTERHSGVWKSMWERVVEDQMILGYVVKWAITQVSNAKNQLRNKDGFSPRQWLFGVNLRLPGDVIDDPQGLATHSAVTADAKMQRTNAIRLAARTAFIKVQALDAVRRGLLHQARVKKQHNDAGDLVFIFRESRPARGKKAVKQWLGPCTVVPEGQNLWVSKGGRCLLCAPEHVRPAEAEELGELLRVKASLKDIEEILLEKGGPSVAYAPDGEVEDNGEKDVYDELFDDIAEDDEGAGDVVEMDNMDWAEARERGGGSVWTTCPSRSRRQDETPSLLRNLVLHRRRAQKLALPPPRCSSARLQQRRQRETDGIRDPMDFHGTRGPDGLRGGREAAVARTPQVRSRESVVAG